MTTVLSVFSFPLDRFWLIFNRLNSLILPFLTSEKSLFMCVCVLRVRGTK